jgi:hypothetical protein
MVEVLERIAEVGSSAKVLEQRDYSAGSKGGYSAFAEMYLEKPLNIQAAKVTCTVCTWRKVPTIDDW